MIKYFDKKTNKEIKVGEYITYTIEEPSGDDFIWKSTFRGNCTTAVLETLAELGIIEKKNIKDAPKTHKDYITEKALQAIIKGDEYVSLDCPTTAVMTLLLKQLKKDFDTPIIDGEAWVFSNIALKFLPIAYNKIDNPNLVVMFAKEDIPAVSKIVKPYVEALKNYK
jgi:hypothetical protein